MHADTSESKDEQADRYASTSTCIHDTRVDKASVYALVPQKYVESHDFCCCIFGASSMAECLHILSVSYDACIVL